MPACGLMALQGRVVENHTSRALPVRIRFRLLQTLHSPITRIVAVLLMAVVLLRSELVRHGSPTAIAVTTAAIRLLLRYLAASAIPTAPPARHSTSYRWPGRDRLVGLPVHPGLEHDLVLYALSFAAACGIGSWSADAGVERAEHAAIADRCRPS